jgi:hypothetical protein
MQRILILVAVLLLIWRFLAARTKRMAKTAAGADDFSRFSFRSRQRRQRQQRERADELLECANCGTYVPAERALRSGDDGQVFCCQRCAEEKAVE